MQTLKKYFQILYQFLKTHKSKWFVLIVLSGTFFLIRFPYEEAVLYLMNKVTEQTKFSIKLKYKSFYINPLGPSLVFNNPEILTTNQSTSFKAEQLSLRPSYTALLQLKTGGVITLKWPDSVLNMTIRKKQIEKNKPGWFIHIDTHNFNPVFLRFFIPILSKTSGKINLDMEMLLDPKFEKQPEGSWFLNGTDFHSQALSYTFPGAIGAISLPSFQWNRIHSNGEIRKGEIIISDIALGTKKDAFQLKTRGIISIDIKKDFSKKIKPRLKNYNMGMEILINEDLKPKLYFLDLFFSSIESKTSQGWRYLGHIKGNTANFFDLSPVSQLPTLKEIQNPVVTDDIL